MLLRDDEAMKVGRICHDIRFDADIMMSQAPIAGCYAIYAINTERRR